MRKKGVGRYKRIMAMALAAGILLQGTIVAYAAEGVACNAAVIIQAETEDILTDESAPGTGFIIPEDRTAQSVITESEVPLVMSSQSESSYYLTEKLPEIRHQGSYGVCWAFATLGCMEINLMKKGYEELDLSELHLAYYAYHSVDEPLGGFEGDSITYVDEDTSFMQIGGNDLYASNALMDWRGAVLEETVPYSMAADVEENGLADEYAYEGVARLQGVRYIDMEDTAFVKQAIVDYGAVQISYHAKNSYISNIYYNADTAGYYCYDANMPNHAVVVVGWDDDYSAANFPTEPEGDGAWIVRNSWGSSYGEAGYFYLSYYDRSIWDEAVAYDAGLAEEYDNNYQYDGSALAGYSSYGKNIKVANVFQAKACEDGAEIIEAASFETASVNCEYTISVYKNLTDVTNPESGELSTSISGVTTHEGIYTVFFEDEVYVDEDVLFSIVIDITAKDNDYVYIKQDGNSISSYLESATAAGSHQSFCYQNGSWEDYGAEKNTNYRIKAYTSNVDKKETIYADSITLDKTQLLLNVGESYKLTAAITPENTTNKAVTWSSSDETIVAVDSTGNVTALKRGDAVITAKTADGKQTVQCKVQVMLPLEYIYLSSNRKTITTSETWQLEVVYVPEDTTDSKLVEWSVKDKSIATVDENGLVKPVAPGTTTITATVGEYSDTATVIIMPVYPNSVSLDVTKSTIKVDESVTWTATVYPSDATDKTVTWTSSNKSIATVDSNGKITGVSAGSATIKASAYGRYGEVSSSYTIIVEPKIIPLETIEIKTSADNVNVGESITLQVDYLPTDTTDSKTTEWTSSDITIATVNSQGVVTGIKPGEVTITAVSGACTDNCVIRVNSDTTVQAKGILTLELTRDKFVAGMDAEASAAEPLQYSWSAYNKTTGKTIEIQDWTDNNQWLNWEPDSFGEYVVTGMVRPKYNPAAVSTAQTEAFEFNPHIKGKCQMPYYGEGGGYLIGVESYENPNQSYYYEMLILDCTLLAQGKDAWVYTTGKYRVDEGNAGWCIWQPQYGYYWTLFRVYDADGNMIDQACYGFANAY